MKILKVDEKWSIQYDDGNNDRPEWFLRHGSPHFPFPTDNATVALFYALKEKSE